MAGGPRDIWKAAALAAWLGLAPSHASANERLCLQLETELAQASFGSDRSQLAKYDRAVATQREELNKARTQAREARCGYSLREAGPDLCDSLNLTIERMVQNLAGLQHRRRELAQGSGAQSEYSRLLAALDANGCRSTTLAIQDLPGEDDGTGLGPSPSGHLFDDSLEWDDSDGEELSYGAGRVIVPGQSDQFGLYDHYRTVCVRTCDGYYFPISPASSVDEFQRDQHQCEATCPGTDVQLFYQDIGIDSAASMVSTATGRTYEELPAAFRYRRADTVRRPECSCKPALSYGAGRVIVPGQSDQFGLEDRGSASCPRAGRRESEGAFVRKHHHIRRACRSNRRRCVIAPTDPIASARRKEGQGRRPKVFARPRRGNRSASSGPEGRPVSASLSGMNNALPLRSVFSLT